MLCKDEGVDFHLPAIPAGPSGQGREGSELPVLLLWVGCPLLSPFRAVSCLPALNFSLSACLGPRLAGPGLPDSDFDQELMKGAFALLRVLWEMNLCGLGEGWWWGGGTEIVLSEVTLD